ncbi:oligosaccharide flippase family protein [Saccharibacillus alkalitolerans]|uniref:Oligosaccharide flippase family protein n=1 Tax=Saccharibacillus alkalitolerans TaxID=2705290 RepID=A0ABX0FB21_9BACL|nr:oligosaccharide flippase family protein [Saccharibacillus alkalitolerans]NGZ78136.1 oligosaccharide flippase family protein [Saccharibacillus alkalitolerans]
MKTPASSGLLRGAFILGTAAILSKLIGTLQKIPLQNIGGDGVFGIYTTVYSFYAFLAVFVTAALPAAISKYVAERTAESDERGVRKVLFAGLLTACSAGLLMALGMWSFAPALSGWIGSEHTLLPLRAAALALLVVPPMAALRGFFQGLQQALPTAVSQVTEQIVRVGVMVALLLTLNAAGASDERIAAGAALGSAGGGLAGLGAMLLFWRRYGRSGRAWRPSAAKLAVQAEREAEEEALRSVGASDAYAEKEPGFVEAAADSAERPKRFTSGQWAKRLLIYAVPVFVGSLSQPLLNLVDTLTVPRLLQGAGWNDLASMEQFGVYNRGIPLVQLVFMLATSLSTLLLPAIAEAKARGEEDRIRSSAGTSLRWLWILGLTAAAGLAALAEPVNVMLYADAEGTDALRWTALSAAGGTLGIVSAALLQGIGAVRAPALFLIVSAALKLVLNLLLVPQMGISGAALAGAVSYMAAALLGVLVLARLTGLRGGVRRALLQPLLLAGLTALAAYSARLLCGVLLSAAELGGRAGALLTSVAGVAAGVLVFAAALVYTRAVSDAELSALPGGAKLAALARRLRREA